MTLRERLNNYKILAWKVYIAHILKEKQYNE